MPKDWYGFLGWMRTVALGGTIGVADELDILAVSDAAEQSQLVHVARPALDIGSDASIVGLVPDEGVRVEDEFGQMLVEEGAG